MNRCSRIHFFRLLQCFGAFLSASFATSLFVFSILLPVLVSPRFSSEGSWSGAVSLVFDRSSVLLNPELSGAAETLASPSGGLRFLESESTLLSSVTERAVFEFDPAFSVNFEFLMVEEQVGVDDSDLVAASSDKGLVGFMIFDLPFLLNDLVLLKFFKLFILPSWFNDLEAEESAGIIPSL
nr:hypothetical protein Iba_chr14aCG15250 [Ipomoea batatas]